MFCRNGFKSKDNNACFGLGELTDGHLFGRKTTSASWLRNWLTAWRRPRMSAVSCNKILIKWSMNFARCVMRLQKLQGSTSKWQVSRKIAKSGQLQRTNPHTFYRRTAYWLASEARAWAAHRWNRDLVHENQRVDKDVNLRRAETRETPSRQDRQQVNHYCSSSFATHVLPAFTISF